VLLVFNHMHAGTYFRDVFQSDDFLAGHVFVLGECGGQCKGDAGGDEYGRFFHKVSLR